MTAEKKSDGRGGLLAAAGVLLLPALCCGLPLLVASGALAGITGVALGGIVAGVAAAAVAVTAVVVARRRARRTARSADRENCCPSGSASD